MIIHNGIYKEVELYINWSSYPDGVVPAYSKVLINELPYADLTNDDGTGITTAPIIREPATETELVRVRVLVGGTLESESKDENALSNDLNTMTQFSFIAFPTIA